MTGQDLPARLQRSFCGQAMLRTRPQRWRVAPAGWVAMQAGGVLGSL